MGVEQQLRQALSQMINAIEQGPAAAGPPLIELIGQVDRLKEQLGPATPKMLGHYLEKRSYTKALDFLEGRDETAEPGC